MITRTYTEIINEMKNRMIAGQKKITDFNEGSGIMTIFESVARPLETAYIDTRAGYTDILRMIAYEVFDFKKKEGVKAVVKLVFSSDKPVSQDVVIPMNTRISNGTLVFITNSATVIKKDEINSAVVEAQAENIGVEYNVLPNTLTQIDSSVPLDVVTVTNPSKAEKGANEESESEMLARFKEYINGLQGSNEYGIRYGVRQLPGVRSVGLKEHFPPKNNVYNFTVYIDDGTGNMTDELREEVHREIYGDNTSLYPGRKACGINVDILPASVVQIDINVTCTIYRTAIETANKDIKDAIEDLINGKGIGEDIILTDIILKLRKIGYITDVSELLINGFPKNIAIGEDSIARLNNLTIKIGSES